MNIFNQTAKAVSTNKALLAAAIASLLLTACGGSDNPETSKAAKEKAVNISFKAMTGKKPVTCDDELTLGTANTKARIADLRFYVSKPYLLTKAGKKVTITLDENPNQQSDLALIDLENGTAFCKERGTSATYSTLVGKAVLPKNDPIIGTGFTIGVPTSKNHSDYATAKAPLDIQGMSWSWQIGRKFIKAEVSPHNGVAKTIKGKVTTQDTFNVHLGSTNCQGGVAKKNEVPTCTYANRMQVQLKPKSGYFDTNKHAVAFDVASLFSSTNISKDDGGKLGCMSFQNDPECHAIFSQLGLDITTGKPFKDTAKQQAVFKLVTIAAQ